MNLVLEIVLGDHPAQCITILISRAQLITFPPKLNENRFPRSVIRIRMHFTQNTKRRKHGWNGEREAHGIPVCIIGLRTTSAAFSIW